MIKWFAYIVLLLILIPCLSSAKFNDGAYRHKSIALHTDSAFVKVLFNDTTLKKKQQEADEKKKIKEVAKAKRLPKPEKVDENGSANSQNKAKPKRQRRPAGLERPPEIPRRNGN
jgi:hypothetical protein